MRNREPPTRLLWMGTAAPASGQGRVDQQMVRAGGRHRLAGVPRVVRAPDRELRRHLGELAGQELDRVQGVPDLDLQQPGARTLVVGVGGPVRAAGRVHMVTEEVRPRVPMSSRARTSAGQ
jgi:hypothetical protein